VNLRKVLKKNKKGRGNHVTHAGSPKNVSHCAAVITAGREDTAGATKLHQKIGEAQAHLRSSSPNGLAML
jgi:hypothetical protein